MFLSNLSAKRETVRKPLKHACEVHNEIMMELDVKSNTKANGIYPLGTMIGTKITRNPPGTCYVQTNITVLRVSPPVWLKIEN